jgi:UDP-3-O-[3-hydroxymyristoyl] glucosamine N-acyltransferase
MHCYIGKEVEIGEESIISHNVTILEKVTIGKRVKIYPNTVIGGPGFAYLTEKEKHIHIPHKGKVIIEDEVEIGVLCSIDRALVGATVIKKGTKIDNMVHIAHNVVVGKNSIIVAQAGIAGSVKIGDNVIIGGQAGITDHITIGKGAKIGGQAGVTKDVPSKVVVCGYPARPRRISNLAYSLLTRLPELFKRVKKIEEKCKIR